jgi:hypothetical protein
MRTSGPAQSGTDFYRMGVEMQRPVPTEGQVPDKEIPANHPRANMICEHLRARPFCGFIQATRWGVSHDVGRLAAA